VGYDQGEFTATLGASASVLFGAKGGITVVVNAQDLISQLPTLVSNPQVNPLAPVGQWIGNQAYNLTHGKQ
jgi:hypothetical protein